MITRFDNYEQLNEASDSSAQEDVNSVYQEMPIGELSVSMYAELTGAISLDSKDPLVLEVPLTEDSTMADVVHHYYVENVTDIFRELGAASIDYQVAGIESEILDRLKKANFTVGTVMANAIARWYNDGEPQAQIQKALTLSIDDMQGLNESLNIEALYENALSSTIKRIAQGLSKLKASGKSAAPFAEEIKSSAKSASEIRGSVNRVQRSASDLPRGVNRPGMSPNWKSTRSGSAARGGSATESTWSRMRSWYSGKRADRKIKSKEHKEAVRQRGEGTKKRISKLFTGPMGLMLRGGRTVFRLAKWGLLGWLGYTLFKGLSGDSPSIGVLRTIMGGLEGLLAQQGAMPFSFFSGLASRYAATAEQGDGTAILGAWATSLKRGGILTTEEYDSIVKQLEHPDFGVFMSQHEDLSVEIQGQLAAGWSEQKEFPSPGLMTFAVLSASAALMSKFEDQLDSNAVTQRKELAKNTEPQTELKEVLEIGDQGEQVKALQEQLRTLGVYDGPVDGVYSEEMAKVISAIQKDAQSTNPKIQINGQADVYTLEYLADQIEMLSGAVAGEAVRPVRGETLDQRKPMRDYIQDMKANLSNY